MNEEFMSALNAIEKEKGISKEILLRPLKQPLSAYRRNFSTAANVRVVLDREKGSIKVFRRLTVVEEVTQRKWKFHWRKQRRLILPMK